MPAQLLKEKIEQAVKILNEKNVDMWLTFVRESSVIVDPVLEMIAGINFTWQSALIITKDGDTTAIVGSLEEENIKQSGLYENVISYIQSIREPLLDYIKEKNPLKIAVNYSKNSALADGLTLGLYLQLIDYLKDTEYEDKLISSEEIVSSLRGRKTPVELSIMREAVKETLKIFEEAGNFIKPGKTEIEIAEYIRALAKVEGYDLAWTKIIARLYLRVPKYAERIPVRRAIQLKKVILLMLILELSITAIVPIFKEPGMF